MTKPATPAQPAQEEASQQSTPTTNPRPGDEEFGAEFMADMGERVAKLATTLGIGVSLGTARPKDKKALGPFAAASAVATAAAALLGVQSVRNLDDTGVEASSDVRDRLARALVSRVTAVEVEVEAEEGTDLADLRGVDGPALDALVAGVRRAAE